MNDCVDKTANNSNEVDANSGNLGTFSGVFTPSLLTILGIILFLRLGYVTGQAGLINTLVIIGIANIITVLTSFSLSAVATNLKVKGGGDYYVISRTLGLEFGGAIGVVLFFAQSISIGFYCIGFGEAVFGLLPSQSFLSPQLIACIAISLLFILAWLGADWATKFQYVVMCMLIFSLLSFYIGGFANWEISTLKSNWHASSFGGGSFWVIFAIFFPAVTGFTQGVSMSGDLKDPAKSLPSGTFMAVLLSIVVYLTVALLFCANLPLSILANDYHAMKKVAYYGPLIDAGVISATLSSAMASFLGAPRILQSMAGDRVFPFLLPFAKGYGPSNNPRRGVLLSGLIAIVIIGLGNLNLIAAIVSVFFLMSYGLLNYATYFEAKSETPSFRPRFRWYNYRLSLVGFIACGGVILAIDLKNGIIAFAILFAIYQYLKRSAPAVRWSDSRRSHAYQQIREHLLEISATPEHPRDWRPTLLVLTNNPEQHKGLFHFTSWIAGKSGISTIATIVEDTELTAGKQKKACEEKIASVIASEKLAAYPLAVVSKKVSEGVPVLAQAVGLGPLKVNTIILNWYDTTPTALERWKETRFVNILKSTFRLERNVIVYAGRFLEQGLPEKNESDRQSEEQRIDIWWWDDASSHLMLMLAYLMTRHEDWEDAKLNVVAANYQDNSKANQDQLCQVLTDSRIEAASVILPEANLDKLTAFSAEADMVFAPFLFKNDRIMDPFNGEINDFIIRIKNLVLVKAADDLELDAEPEEGKAGDMAAAADALQGAHKRAKSAEKQALKAFEAAQKVNVKLNQMMAESAGLSNEGFIEKLKRDAQKAEIQLSKATRKVAKEKAKVEIATQDAQSQGMEIKSETDVTEDKS